MIFNLFTVLFNNSIFDVGHIVSGYLLFLSQLEEYETLEFLPQQSNKWMIKHTSTSMQINESTFWLNLMQVRMVISDFGVFITICGLTGLDVLSGVKTPKLQVPSEFKPTWEGRGWFVAPFTNPWWTIPAALAPALLATILIFMDQQITAVIVNRRENKLRVSDRNCNKNCSF